MSLGIKFSGLDMGVGFIKCFLPTSPVDLSNIATSSGSNITTLSVTLSVDPSQAATPTPVYLSKFTFDPPSELKGGPNFFRMPDAWGCVVIPVMKRGVSSYQEPGQLSSLTELGIEFPIISHRFRHGTR